MVYSAGKQIAPNPNWLTFTCCDVCYSSSDHIMPLKKKAFQPPLLRILKIFGSLSSTCIYVNIMYYYIIYIPRHPHSSWEGMTGCLGSSLSLPESSQLAGKLDQFITNFFHKQRTKHWILPSSVKIQDSSTLDSSKGRGTNTHIQIPSSELTAIQIFDNPFVKHVFCPAFLTNKGYTSFYTSASIEFAQYHVFTPSLYHVFSNII